MKSTDHEFLGCLVVSLVVVVLIAGVVFANMRGRELLGRCNGGDWDACRDCATSFLASETDRAGCQRMLQAREIGKGNPAAQAVAP